MGRYFNPANTAAIESTGARRLQGSDHASLSGQLQPGESLGLHLDRGIFKQMPDVTRESEYKEFDAQVQGGRVLLLGVYAVPKDAPGWGG